jgi:hypothetical protein
MQNIITKFPITEEEYAVLDEKFGKLCHNASWQLNKKNSKNNHTDDPEDTVQTLRIALIRAGSYYKRQTFIEACFNAIAVMKKKKKELADGTVVKIPFVVSLKHTDDKYTKDVAVQLLDLWKNKTRHGANRQKFGDYHEELLDMLLRGASPKEDWPDISASLIIDAKFVTYCKQIIWNQQKQMGKKITREKSWRTGLVSLSEFDYLGSTG